MDDDRNENIRLIVTQWERYRIIFNAVVLVAGLMVAPEMMRFYGVPRWGLGAFTFGFIANVFFCLGPLTEIYSLVLGELELGGKRIWFFLAGLILSVGVVFYTAALANSFAV